MVTTVEFGPFGGINTRLPDSQLAKTRDRPFAVLASAVNVEVDNAGLLRTRNLGKRIQALEGAHSLSPDGRYLVRHGVLYRITLPTYTETLVKVLSCDDQGHWCASQDGSLYFSNGADSGRIAPDGGYFQLAMPTPASPTYSLVGGALAAGRYQIAVGYANSLTGEEGGVSPSGDVLLSGTGGIRINLPGAVAGADRVNVYVTSLNGSIPYLQSSVPTGTPYVDVDVFVPGREAMQRFEAPLPGGRLFWFNGALCSYRDNCVYEGIPYRPGYYLPSAGRIPFPAEVSNVVAAQAGVYVVSDKTYWVAGTRMSEAERVVDVLPYGGVPHTEFSLPNKSIYGWFGAHGIVLGSPDGEVDTTMADRVKAPTPAGRASYVLDMGGYIRVISCGWVLNLSNKAITQYSGSVDVSAGASHVLRDDGLYDLAGTGVPVAWSVGFGRQSFGTDFEKRLPTAYLSAISESPVSVTVELPTGVEYDYTAMTQSDALDVHRVNLGKGLRANWFGLSLGGVGEATVAAVSFAPLATQRRI